MTDARRGLPSVTSLLESEGIQTLLEHVPRGVVVDAIRRTIASVRSSHAEAPADAEGWTAAVANAVDDATRRSLRRVINATGVVLHTNLGRAPLAAVGAGRDRPRGARILESRIRRSERPARVALLALRVAAARAHRRRGRAGREQLRGGSGAGAQHAGRRPHGDRVARRIDRDRRKLPHSRDHGAERRAPGRGRHDESHAPRRLSTRAGSGRRDHPEGAPQQLRAVRLRLRRLGQPARGARRRAWRAGAVRSRKRPPDVARVVWVGRRTDGSRRHEDRCVDRDDERRQVAGRAAGRDSSSVRAASSTGFGRTRSRVRTASTSSRSPRWRRRWRSTANRRAPFARFQRWRS